MRTITYQFPAITYFYYLAASGVLIAILVVLTLFQSGGVHIGSVPGITVVDVPENMTVEVINFPENQIVTVANETLQVNVTNQRNGIQDVRFTDPLTAFGSVMTENLSPVYQVDAVYGLLYQQIRSFKTIDGSVSAYNSMFEVTSGSSNSSFGVLQSRKRLRYRAGQGSRAMFTAKFTPGVPGTFQIAGLGHAEDGVYFGYYPTGEFGILHSQRGLREVWNLTFTTGSSSVQNLVITVNDVPYNIPVTNAMGDAYTTAYEVDRPSVFDGWETQIHGSSVIFVYGSALPLTGVFSISGTGIVANFTRVQLGQPSELTFIPQNQWNGEDILDGNGPSGQVLNTTFFNVFQISMQYLGAGAIRFFVEIPQGPFINVHTLEFPNSRLVTSFGNPSFPFTAACYTTIPDMNITSSVQVGSFAGFVEGKRIYTGNRYSIENAVASTVAADAYYAIFSFINPIYFKGRVTQGTLNLLSFSAATASVNPVTFYIFRTMLSHEHVLQGSPNFQPYGPDAAIWVDKAADTFVQTSNDQLILTLQAAQNNNVNIKFDTSLVEDITLQPGDIITIAARTRAGTATWVSAALDLRQDY